MSYGTRIYKLVLYDMMHWDAVIRPVIRSLKLRRTHPSVAGIKESFAVSVGILRLNDIMANSWYSAGGVLSSVFAEEESYNDSDSKRRDDVYGY